MTKVIPVSRLSCESLRHSGVIQIRRGVSVRMSGERGFFFPFFFRLGACAQPSYFVVVFNIHGIRRPLCGRDDESCAGFDGGLQSVLHHFITDELVRTGKTFHSMDHDGVDAFVRAQGWESSYVFHRLVQGLYDVMEHTILHMQCLAPVEDASGVSVYDGNETVGKCQRVLNNPVWWVGVRNRINSRMSLCYCIHKLAGHTHVRARRRLRRRRR